MVTDAIDKYIRDLDYDPRILLSVQPDGATETMPAKTTRSTEGSEVVLTTKTQHSLSKNLTDVAILRPTSGVIFPGALVRADQQLMEGLPTPISLPRGPLTISADLGPAQEQPHD
jgi:thiol-activated cytolysin